MDFLQRLWAATLVGLALTLGVMLVPIAMGGTWDESAISFTIATVGQVLRPQSGLPLYAALVGLVAAWAPGSMGMRVLAGAAGATIAQLLILIGGFLGLTLTLAIWSIPEAALGSYQSVHGAFPWESLVLLPVAAIVGGLVALAVTMVQAERDEPEAEV